MEIHGLRGLAIALVVAYHLWGVGRVSGGVDIFLMISAYLMTLSFVRRGEDFDTGGFLVKRFRQLLPQAALVIASTVAASLALLPPSRWPVIIDQARSSLLYYQNWVLIGLATDYNSPDRSGTSPLQHFWSLSMQGQVFVVWALVMALAVFLSLQMKISIRLTLALAFGLLALSSMTFAWRQVQVNPTAAYFNTFARVWEFALASLLALVPRVRLAKPIARVLGWGGLIGIITCGMTVGHEPFPGPAALLPSLCAAAIVLAGPSSDRTTAAYWLASTPLKFLGDRAYGLYLWHWPVYMLWLGATGDTSVGLLGSLVVIGLSLALADVATRLVERRFNQWGVLQSWPAGLATIAVIVALVLGGSYALPQTGAGVAGKQATGVQVPPEGGAKGATPGVPVPSGEPTRNVAPGDTQIATDWPDFPWCPAGIDPPAPVQSDCAEIAATGTPRKTVVMVGDSHSRQWLTLLRPIAQDNNWRVLVWTRNGCRVALPNKHADPACVEYGRNVTDSILRLRPDFVFTVGTRADPNVSAEEHVETFSELFRPVLDAGIKVINMRDNPRWTFKMPECVQQFGNEPGRCTRPVSEKLAPVSPLLGLDPRMGRMDVTESLCPGGFCNGVIGGTYVYMDDSHLSRAYITTLRPEFEAQLFGIVTR